MNEAILEKIRKLLRLGQSSNQNEAALALSEAFELARQHQIDLESVNVDDEEIERYLMRIGARLSFEQKLILSVVRHFFRVEIIVTSSNYFARNVAFIGRQTDIAIAHYVHDYLLRAVRNGLRDYRAEVRRKLSPTRRKSFIQGWVYGVAGKLDETTTHLAVEDSRFAIVSVENDPRVMAAAKEFYPNARDSVKIETARKDRSAIMAGYRKGNAVDIHQPLAGPAKPALTQ